MKIGSLLRYMAMTITLVLASPALHAADLTVSSTTYSSPTPQIVSATGTISTSGTVTVSSGANVTFEGGLQVRLLPGFRANLGSVFRAVATDSDADGLPDAWENQFLGGMQHGAGADPFGVGRTLAQSYALHINPAHTDTDGDGLGDQWELAHLGTLSYGASADPFGIGRTLSQSQAQSLSPAPAPVVAAGLKAWYRADHGVTKDGTNSVSKWLDASGNGLHLEQSDGPSQPLWVSAVSNGKPGVDFGSGEKMESAVADLLGTSEDFTVIAVVSSAASQSTVAVPVIVDFSADASSGLSVRMVEGYSASYMLSWRDAANTSWQGELAPYIHGTANATQSLMFVKNGMVQTSFLFGTSQASSAVVAAIHAPSGTIQMGGFYAGKVSEVLIYNRALTTTERDQINAALTSKYWLNVQDSDSDGLPDSWELAHLGTLSSGPNDDPDQDGMTNLQELERGLRGLWADNPAISLSIFTPNS